MVFDLLPEVFIRVCQQLLLIFSHFEIEIFWVESHLETLLI